MSSKPSQEDTQESVAPSEQDAAPADPAPSAAPDAQPRQWPFGYLVLWGLVALSLIFNVVLLRQMLIARDAASQAVRDAIVVLDNLQQQQFAYTIVVDETLNIDTDMPVDETIPVLIEQDLPINTTVQATISAGPLGNIPINVPIQATVPVRIEQDLSIDQAFHVQMAIPIYFEIPVELGLENTPLDSSLEDVQARLQELNQRLNTPLIPLPGMGAGATE